MNIRILAGFLAIILLAACAKDSGGLTEGGFKYLILSEGEATKAKSGDYVFFHVDMLTDDEVTFDSRTQGQETAIQLAEVPEGNAINKAMNECLTKATIGDSLLLYVPMDSLRKSGMRVPEDAKLLTYRLRITEIVDEEGYKKKMDVAQAEEEAKAEAIIAQLPAIEAFVAETYQYILSGKGSEDIKSTPSGLQYIIHEKGTGDKLMPGDVATVQYYGILKETGNMFDNSWRRGSTFQFSLGQGQVIPGWDEGVSLLSKGDKATLIIPSNLGYGAAGSPPVIPENADLIFYIEVPNE